MKSNLAIVGTSSKLNNECGIALAAELEINYMDYSEYIEYLTLSKISIIEEKFGKEELRKLYSQKLSSINGYSDSIFAFAGGVCFNAADCAVIADDAYLICLSPSRVCSKVAANCLAVIDTKDKKMNTILDEIFDKLGELATNE